MFDTAPHTWERITLGEIVARAGGSIQTGPFGSQLHASDYVPVGIPCIMPVNIGDNRLVRDGIACIRPSDAERLARHIVRKGDIIYSRRGDVERRALVREAEDGWFCGTGCLKLRLGEGVIEPEFASYYLGHPEVRAWIVRHAVGATMPNLNTSIMESIPFLLPPPDDQRAIAAVLGSLDDKIEVNRRTARALEGLARTIFRSWFVDFDPVRNRQTASAAGQPTALPDDLAALFPTRLVDSPLGDIPEGWDVRPLADHFRLTMGQSPPGSTYNESGDGLPFYQGRTDFGFRFPTPRVYCTAPTRYAEPGDAMVSVRAPVGDVNMAIERCAVGRGVAAVRHKSGSVSFTYYAMHALRGQFLRFEAEGTVFGAIGKSDFERLPFIAPPHHLVDAFEKLAKSLDDRVEACELESATLAALRDALLPKLISGELPVPAAEAMAEQLLKSTAPYNERIPDRPPPNAQAISGSLDPGKPNEEPATWR